jgi:hypothetical protein
MLIAYEIFSDFPNNLPEKQKAPLQDFPTELAKLLANVLTGTKGARTIINMGKLTIPPELHLPFTMTEISKKTLKDAGITQSIDFERLVLSQELIMAFAHLDAFFSESIRAICRIKPDVLKTDKQVSWATALEFDNKQSLSEFLTETLAYELGWGSFEKRISSLKSKFGLDLQISSEILENLRQADLLRNLIAHNGGRVDQEYRQKSNKGNLLLGEPVPLDIEFVNNVSADAMELAGELYTQVSINFFAKTQKEIDYGVLHSEKLDEKLLAGN